MWFKRKPKLSIESLISIASEKLLQEGPAQALEYLRDSPYVSSDSVVRVMHDMVWNHRRILPERFLAEAFLDPIWCQCSVCQHIWLISPLLSSDKISCYQTLNTGLECSSCGRVLCSQCAEASDVGCPCGGTFSSLCRPNGRKHRKQSSIEPEEWGWHPPQPDTPLEYDKDLHLYFGYDGKIPIGLDLSFPLKQTASALDHLDWAEMLLDAGVFYQAQQQLDLLEQPDASSARANWLRARLQLIRLRNATERNRRRLDCNLVIPKWFDWPGEIKQWLDIAIQQLPEFGPAWLTAAQVHLDPICGQNFERGLECAQHAQVILGETPSVLFAVGRALRGLGRASEAVEMLSRIPSNFEETNLVQQELEIAEIEARCQSEHIDVDTHLRLGRWCLRHDQRDRAANIFAKLLVQCPNRAEGYYGLACIAFLEPNKSQFERMTEAYRLCREALTRNSNFGLAYELLGSIFRNLHYSEVKMDFTVGNPFDHFRHAIQLDSTCDVALWLLAEDHINRGELKLAIELLERAANLDTDISSVYFLLAAIYRGIRQFEKENWAFRKAIELSPGTELSTEYKDKILKLCGFVY